MGKSTEISWTDHTTRLAARSVVNVAVKFGRMPRPNSVPCVDCGHTWQPGERRHEYDHHLGYDAEHYFAVEPVCTICHARRSYMRGEVPKYRNAAADEAPLADLYQRHTLAEVAAIARVPEETVRRRLIEGGVALRRKGEKPRG